MTRIKMDKKIKVLMIVRSNCYTSPGGDTVQIEMTAKYLRQIGQHVEIETANNVPQYHNYDLIHFFNVIRPDDILPHINHTVPFVVSTIFVDYSEYERINRGGAMGLLFKYLGAGFIEYIKAIGRLVKNGDRIKSKFYLLRGHDKSIKHIVERAAILLPNSDSEYSRLVKSVGVDKAYAKIVNAIDPEVFQNEIDPDLNYDGHVLCVGRIEGRKNQLNLIKALMGTELKLTIIGKPSPNHMEYYEQCKQLAEKVQNVSFVKHISHSELVRIYKAARVHVLPSWFETTGLSSLEAAVMGCNIVVTPKGDTQEYFGTLAEYCEPDDVSSIRNAVYAAYNKPLTNDLRDFVLSHFTWEIAAQQTLRAYESVLKLPEKNT